MGLLDVEYFGWDFKRVPGDILQFTTMFLDQESGDIYLGGERRAGTFSEAIVLKSSDHGKSWNIVDIVANPVQVGGGISACYGITRSGSLYFNVGTLKTSTSGQFEWYVRRSTTGLSGSWETVDIQGPATTQVARKVLIHPSGSIFVIGSKGSSTNGWIVRRSTSGGIAGSWQDVDTQTAAIGVQDIAVDTTGNIYVAGPLGSSFNIAATVRKSEDNGDSWTTIESLQEVVSRPWMYQGIDVDKDDNIYVCGNFATNVTPTNNEDNQYFVRRSTTGLSGSFETVDFIPTLHESSNQYFVRSEALDVAVNPEDGGVYVVGKDLVQISGASLNQSSGSSTFIRHSPTGDSGSFYYVDWIPAIGISNFGGVNAHDFIDHDVTRKNTIVRTFRGVSLSATSSIGAGNFISTGRPQTNREHFGEILFSPSVSYVTGSNHFVNLFNGQNVFEVSASANNNRHLLGNISEFPYFGGAFQMRNMIVGTTDSGKLGTDDDSIIQVAYFGSVVHVMWPNQGRDNIPTIKGFGDFSTGQKPGKLTNNFAPGTTVDVKDFDHMTLYCYLRKAVSGTLDSVEIIVERKPLRDVPFTTEQTIQYATSGSYTTAELTDLRYKKVINYGDLSISEIGFPIDVPLENVKQVRISAKHTNGQAVDVNKNFIVWGRFIKSEEET